MPGKIRQGANKYENMKKVIISQIYFTYVFSFGVWESTQDDIIGDQKKKHVCEK